MSVNMVEEAARLERALQDHAKKLGLRIKVTYDPADFSFFVDCGLRPPPRASHSVDEDILVRQPSGSTYVADLFQRVLEELQRRTHDAYREQMDKLDVRERVIKLSKEDKATLHDMLMCATEGLYKPFTYGNDAGAKAQEEKRQRFADLVGRLFR